jgi:tetratricopeptide (TPR) repeat protein
VAEALTPDERQMAQVELLRGQIAFASSMGTAAPPLLLKAAQRLERLDPELARETYLDAWGAALFAGRLTSAGRLLEVSRAATSAPRPTRPLLASDLLLDGLATFVTEEHAAAARLLRRATAAFADEASDEASPRQENFRWGWMTTIPPNILWDEASWHAISARHLEEARDAGALARLPIDLADWGIFCAWCGDFGAAAVAIAETEAITTATGTHIAPYAQLLLAALRGQGDALPLIESTIRDAGTGGQGLSVQWAEWVSAILFNGLGRYDRALASAQRAAEETPQLHVTPWALTELVEAAVRTARPDVAAGALERVMAATAPSTTDWGRGMQARCRALLSEGESAERPAAASPSGSTRATDISCCLQARDGRSPSAYSLIASLRARQQVSTSTRTDSACFGTAACISSYASIKRSASERSRSPSTSPAPRRMHSRSGKPLASRQGEVGEHRPGVVSRTRFWPPTTISVGRGPASLQAESRSSHKPMDQRTPCGTPPTSCSTCATSSTARCTTQRQPNAPGPTACELSVPRRAN